MNTVRQHIIKGIAALSLLATASVAGAGATPTAGTNLVPGLALSKLLSGNTPFTNGNFANLSKMSQPGIRNGLLSPPDGPGQAPYAIVLGCSDSRVPVEIIFNKGLGEVFPIRVAGNVIADHEIGSIEYAVEHLCAPLIVVMGHTSCGAVTAAVDQVLANVAGNFAPEKLAPVPPATDGTYINTLVNTLIPPVAAVYNRNPSASRATLIDNSIIENVKYVADDLHTKSLIVRDAVDIGMPAKCVNLPAGTKAKIVGGKYVLATGQVELIQLPPFTSVP